MDISKKGLCVLAVLALIGFVGATQHLVPSQYQHIQSAINAAASGDTVSVWGPIGVPPPYTYYENIIIYDKDVFVVNRSFLPNGGTGYDSSWDHVTIDGGGNDEVVRLLGSENPVLKGFTIQNGFTFEYGGGVACTKGSVLKNHILNNFSSIGGGVGLLNSSGTTKRCWIEDNLIENNTAAQLGGGIGVWAMCCDIRRNVVRNNTSESNQGGGISLMYGVGTPPTSHDSITDNVIVGNHLTGSGWPTRGGGIYAWEWPRAARRNVVTDNDYNGVYVHAQYFGPLDLGNENDPGFNVLMSNGSYDLVYDQNPDPVRTVGNYWGYLHTDSILARISAFPSTNVLYDPVAASSRWFDVDLTPVSTCSMDVLVTGDLRVSRSLTISPGKKLAFYLIPDTSLPGGNPNLTDFIVEGSGTVLTSSGTAEDTILYHSKRFFGDFEMAGDWYGIRVKNGAEASFSYSEIRSAYCGIDVEPVGSAQVTSSRLHDCLFAGAYGRQGALSLQQSNVSFNETYGVRYEAQDATAHCGVGQCTLNHNGYAGVSLAGAAASDAPNWIQYNQIAGGWSSPLAQNGIEVLDGGNWVSVENNDVSDFSQTGIATTASSPSFGYNNVHDNHVEGIAFYEGSSPDAYGNSVTGNDLIGIACYSSSPSLRHNTVTANAGAGILCAEGSSPYVRWNSVNEHQYGVCCDATSCPDLGTEEDPGNNSILFNNAVWVTQDSAAQNGIEAIFNYWGVPDPSQYPQKFIGYIEYAPWLTSPPQGGGQQNAGVASLHLVTGLDRLQPMPMRSTARIHFQVARGGQIALSIVDASGRTIRSLVRGDREPGRYNVTWNRTDDHGRIVPAGVYFCTLSAENRRFCKKVVLTE